MMHHCSQLHLCHGSVTFQTEILRRRSSSFIIHETLFAIIIHNNTNPIPISDYNSGPLPKFKILSIDN